MIWFYPLLFSFWCYTVGALYMPDISAVDCVRYLYNWWRALCLIYRSLPRAWQTLLQLAQDKEEGTDTFRTAMRWIFGGLMRISNFLIPLRIFSFSFSLLFNLAPTRNFSLISISSPRGEKTNYKPEATGSIRLSKLSVTLILLWMGKEKENISKAKLRWFSVSFLSLDKRHTHTELK